MMFGDLTKFFPFCFEDVGGRKNYNEIRFTKKLAKNAAKEPPLTTNDPFTSIVVNHTRNSHSSPQKENQIYSVIETRKTPIDFPTTKKIYQ